MKNGVDWLFTPARPSRQTDPISSGVTRNSGPMHKYPNRAIPL